MRVLVNIGEMGITVGRRDVLLRPSFYAMSKLGTGPEIIETFARLHGHFDKVHPLFDDGNAKRQINRLYGLAVDVVAACTEEDITELTGHLGTRYNSWVPGLIPIDELTVLARRLMQYGVVGVVPPGPKLSEEEKAKQAAEAFKSEFDPRDFVAQAVAHLGLSEGDAWSMTITSFILAMRAKFPPAPVASQKAPNSEELAERMKWLERVNAQRKGSK